MIIGRVNTAQKKALEKEKLEKRKRIAEEREGRATTRRRRRREATTRVHLTSMREKALAERDRVEGGAAQAAEKERRLAGEDGSRSARMTEAKEDDEVKGGGPI